eukprot:6470273-Amphidinium_carterae.1
MSSATGPHRRVVVYNAFARCLDCHQRTGKVRGKFNFPYPRRQECRPLEKTFAQRQDAPNEVLQPEAEPQGLAPRGRNAGVVALATIYGVIC